MTASVLVPMDGSAQSEAALEYALGLDVPVTVLTVIDPFDVDPLSPGYQSPVGRAGMPAYSQEWYRREWDNVSEYHEEVCGAATDEDADVSCAIKLGNPSREILRYADEHDVDQIAIGSTSEHGLSQLLMGSTAEAVTKRAPVTVTVVRD